MTCWTRRRGIQICLRQRAVAQAFLSLYSGVALVTRHSWVKQLPVTSLARKPEPSLQARTHFWWGGLCTDVSLMNKHSHSKANRSCVLAGGLRTGGVFRGVVAWCSEHGGDLDFLGNEHKSRALAELQRRMSRAT